MKASSLLFALFLSLNASATCMQTCNDNDAGIDPRYFGMVTVTTSCAAPGGPVTRTRSEYDDRCSDGRVTEHYCSGAGNGAFGMARAQILVCKSCDPQRPGVCLRPGRVISDQAADQPSHSCSTTSGGEPLPTPSPSDLTR